MPRRTLLALIVLLTLLLPACAGGTVLLGGSEEELVVYSGRGQNLIGPLLERYNAQTDTPVAVRYGDSSELALLLAEEGEHTEADVFLAQSPGAVAFLAEQDMLATLDRAVLDLVDPHFASASDRWVGLSGRPRVLVHNTELVAESELPESVFDLTDPAYRGRVAVAPPNGSFQDFVSAMRLEVGDERARAWLEGLVANDVRTYPNNNAIVDAVSRGEVDMGLVNHYYNYRFLEEDPSLPSRNAHFAPGDIGNLVIVSSVSMIEGTDKPEAAHDLIEFLLSPEAQHYFREETFEYPLAAGLEADPELPSLADQDLPSVNFDALGAELRSTVEMIDASGLSV